MNGLKIIEHEGIRVLTTKQLAEVYETTETNIKTNFNRNKERFIEGRDYYCLKGNALKEFKNRVTDSNDPSIKYASVLYLWTERGANRHSKILDTDKAWQQFDVLEETYFKVKTNQISIPTSDREILQLVIKVNENTAQRVDDLEEQVKELKDNQCISSVQYNYLNRVVGERIREIEIAKKVDLNDTQHTHLFKALDRDLIMVTQSQYRSQIKVKDYDKALAYIKKWEPNWSDIQFINQLSLDI